MVLVASVIGVIGAWGGAYLGARGTITTQREQAEQDRQGEARTKRAKTYSDLLKAAERYSAADLSFQSEVERTADLDRGDRCKKRKGQTCGVSHTVFAEWFQARSKFRNALDQIHIYGSSAGLTAARQLEATLPPSLNDEKGFPTYRSPREPEGFYSAYTVLLRLMCREVSPDPRPAC